MPYRTACLSFVAGLLRVFAVISMFWLAACSGDEKEVYQARPVDEIYNDALNKLQAGNPAEAALGFEEVERQHPYSSWARKSQVMASYAYYLANKYDDAVLAGERFLQLHPGNEDAPYVFYLIGISYYEQITDVGRDQRITELALKSLGEVVERYPNSEYARDARLKIDLTRDHLAGKEMEIGRYYQSRANYAAAINRFRFVIENFQTTTHVPEALHRLTESYLALGVERQAQTAAAVLGHNFPGSDWYRDSYALLTGRGLEPESDEGSWLSRLTDLL